MLVCRTLKFVLRFVCDNNVDKINVNKGQDNINTYIREN
jgi:hypothetical protein